MRIENDSCFGCLRNCPRRLNAEKAPIKTVFKQAFNALIAPILSFCIGLFVCRLLFPNISIDISLTVAIICFFIGAAVRLLVMQIS
ncbi:MAG: hypothetical protein LBH75_01160 [Treponema sp.]|nr:hypothetical protein [Treponema sp.]